MSARGDAKKLLQELKALGFKIEGGGGRHYRLLPPNGGRIQIITCSPSDPNAATYLAKALKSYRKEIGA